MAIFKGKSFSRFVSIVFTLYVVLSAGTGWANAASSLYGDEEIIVKFKEGTSITSTLKKHDLKIEKSISKLKVHKVRFNKNKTRDSVLQSLSKDSTVEYAQPNYTYTAIQIPNDPSYNAQWGLPRIKANLAWDISWGNDSITIAVVDTGVDANHPDLSANLVYGYNAITNTSNTDDDQGHGTHVAGIASGIINNNRGIAGVSGKSKIMPIKALSSTGSGYTSDIGEGIMWAADRGAKVINLSLGGPYYDQYLQDSVNYAYNKGALIIAAAGNSNTSAPSYPAALNNVVAISAVDQSNSRASFSNYGSYIDLAAPGVSIYSTTYDGGYGYKSGTSMAAPFVAGAAALIWSLDNNKSAGEIETILKSTAYDLGYLGRDDAFGYGLIDVYNAIKVIEPSPGQTPSPSPVTTPTPGTVPTPNPGSSPSAQPSAPIPDVTPSIAPVPTPSPVYTLAPIGNIDKPSDLETISGTYTVKGWFLDKDGVAKIEVFVDGQLKGQAIYGDSRPDIGSLYPQYNNNNSGFHFSLDTTKLSSGTHILTVKETSNKGTQTTLSGKLVIVSNNGSVTPSPAPAPSPAPNTKTSNINYYLSESAYVTITIHNSFDRLVRTLENGTLKKEGLNSVNWDGKDSSGNMVPDGVYTYKIVAVDLSGLEAEPITGTIIVERFNPSITKVSDGPDPLDLAKGQANTINYTVSENARVAIKIYDVNGSLIRDLINEEVIIGANNAAWDGKDDDGSFVLEGTYKYSIDAVDSFDKKSETVSGIISVGEVDLPVISDLSSSPDPFVPDGKNSVTISYKLSKDAKAGIEIYDSTNTLIKVIESGISKKAGANSASWDGKNSSGIFVPDGSYTYKITAIDSIGFEAVPKSGVIKVSGGGKNQLISSAEDTPDPFVPDGSSVNTISFELSKDAQLKIFIYNSQGNLVRKLTDGKAYAGTNSFTWNGSNDIGAVVDSETYTYVITAINTQESLAQQVTGTITVDSTAPVISNDTVNPNPFIPTGANNTTITYTLSEAAKTTITIYDSMANKVTVLENSTDKKAGVNSTLWNGKNASDILVPKGTYSYKIEAVNDAGLEATPVVGTIHISDEQIPLIYEVNDTPDPFKADGKATSTIMFTLSKDVELTLDMANKSGAIVKKLVDGKGFAGNNVVTWNGQNDSGTVVDPGTYTYTITAVDKENNKSQVYSGTITVDMSGPGVSGTSFNPNPFTPDGTNTGTLSYTLSESASVTTSILDSRSNIVRTLESSASNKAGLNTVLWDGRNSSGIIVPDGNYTYKIEAKSPAGQSTPVLGLILVDGKSPLITGVIDTPDPFAPDGTKVNTISFTLSEEANVKINLYDINNDFIKTLTDSTMPSGQNKVTWDGKDSAGNIVESGLYLYTVEVEDNFGNLAPKVTGTITVDLSVPRVTLIGVSPNPFKSAGTGLEYIFFNLNHNALTTIKIYDKNNLLVKTIEEDKLRGFGANHATWDGRNLSGQVVNDGKYTYRITAKSPAGIEGDSKEGTIHIIKTDSLITSVNDSPDPFKPLGSNVNTISFTLNKRSNVSLNIYDMEGNLVKSIFEGVLNRGLQSLTWDGKDKSGQIVDSGIYTYRLMGSTKNEKEASDLIGTITIDFETPEVKILNISPDPFVPSDNNEVTVTYSLSKKAYTTVEIFDSFDNLIKAVETDSDKLSGINFSVWDGRNSSGGLVANGTYKVTVTARDEAGNSTSESGYVNVKHLPPEITAVKDSPDPFNPKKTVNTIEYDITKDAITTIKLYNSENNLIATLFEGNANMGSNAVQWNGCDSTGSIVPDGTYKYTINAKDIYGGRALPVSGTIDVFTESAEISDTFVNLIPFVPEGTNELTIFYNLTGNAKISLSIYDDSGKLVNTPEDSVSKNKGLNFTTWNGKDLAGKIAAPGTYTYKVEASDLSDGTIVTANGEIIVEKYDATAATHIVDFEKELDQYEVSITGTPDGDITRTVVGGDLGHTGAVLNFISPDFYSDHYLGLSDDEKFIITFPKGPVIMAEVELAVAPTTKINNNYAGVIMKAYDTAGNLIGSKTQTFMGITNNTRIPVKIKVVSSSSNIAKVTLESSEDIFYGVFLATFSYNSEGTGDGTTPGTPAPTPDPGTQPGEPTPSDPIGQQPGTPDSPQPTPGEPEPVPLEIINHSINPDPLDPTVVSNAVVAYTLSAAAKVTVAIYDNTETLVKTLETDTSKNAGQSSAVWDGKDPQGNPVSAGTYIYKITACSSVGSEKAEAQGKFTVTISALTISAVSDTPDPFGANGTKVSTIKYKLSKGAAVTIKIYDSSKTLVKALISDKVNSGFNSVTWDGKNESGRLVKDGKYTYTIDAQDPYGGKAPQASGTIDLDATPPRITQHFVDPPILGL